jgi:hypothetical protein
VSLRRMLAPTCLVVSSAFFSACLAPSAPEESLELGETEQSVSSATYYTARIDVRRCAYPMCGGIFVSAVNQEWTTCADGTVAKECYVAELDLAPVLGERSSEAGFVRDAIGPNRETTRIVLLGDLDAGSTGHGKLLVRMAWLAPENLALRGRFYRVVHNGIVCVAAPCPSFDEEYLNAGTVNVIHEVNLQEVPVPDEQRGEALQSVYGPHGLIIVGRHALVRDAGPAGPGVFLNASQFFAPLARVRR